MSMITQVRDLHGLAEHLLLSRSQAVWSGLEIASV